MATITPPQPPAPPWIPGTVAELLEHLGVPPGRVRLHPPIGTATERDATDSKHLHGALCELVDGTLVEKAMGYFESRLGHVLSFFMETHLTDHPIGFVLGEAGPVKTVSGRVRMPDVGFYRWDQFPGGVLPPGGVIHVPVLLAVEILSPSNTAAEMELKRREYFASGTRLYWEVHPATRQVRVYHNADEFTLLGENDTLAGDPVMPGFRLPIRVWFDRAGNRPLA